jgi:hypothetical protein
MPEVFLSYSHANKDRVTPIATGLTRDGVDVWWDQHMEATANVSLAVTRVAKRARRIVVVWSRHACESDWVVGEAWVGHIQKKLVQIKLDTADPPIPFIGFHWLDFSAWTGDAGDEVWRKLLHAVRTEDPPYLETFVSTAPANRFWHILAFLGPKATATLAFSASLTALLLSVVSTSLFEMGLISAGWCAAGTITAAVVGVSAAGFLIWKKLRSRKDQ